MKILDRIEEHAAELRRLGARRMGVFGSCARGEEQAGSDVDVYIEFENSARTFDNFFAIHVLLERLFGRPIDLVTDKALSETKARLILPTVKYARLDP
jgi:predicted nucleotidyltransferase